MFEIQIISTYEKQFPKVAKLEILQGLNSGDIMYIFGFREETALFKLSLTLLLPFFIFVLFLSKWIFRPSKVLKNLPPSPPKLPIIGNLHQLGSIPQRSLKSLAHKYGSIMLLRLGSKPVLVVTSADAAEEVLKTHDTIFASRPQTSFARRLLYNFKDIAFAPYGDYWRRIKSICVLQLLSNKRVQSFKSVREEEILLMLEKIRESCLSSSVICMSKNLATLTNDIVSRIAIGKRYSGEKDGSNFKELFGDAFMLLGVFNVGDYIPWLAWINHINGLEAKLNKTVNGLDKFWENIVEEGIKRREKRVSEEGEGEEEKGHQNFVDVLLEVQRENATGFSLDRDSIKAIIQDMFAGGTDTISTLLEWAFAELLKNTNVMTRLQNEVRHFSSCNSDHITEDDLEKLPYLKAVIKETFRMHPPFPLLVPRESRMDVKMMGYDIAAGTQVFINAWAIGRDPSLWEDADEFQPERFLNSSINVTGQDFRFIPFGSGRRMCPGSGFGLVTAELTLSNLIRKFNFALADGATPEKLDMTEAHGLVGRRKIPLLLIASLPN